MIAWWLVFAVSISVYILLIALVLPKMILRAGYVYPQTKDRGLANYKEKKGRLIVYEPCAEARRVIKQYILESRNGKTVIVCKVDRSVRFVDFDVTVYDENGKPFGVVKVTCPIKEAGFTSAAELPEETSYVSIIINEVDGKKYSNGALAGVSGWRFALYVVVSAIFSILETLLMRVCLTNLFGGIFFESYLLSDDTLLFSLIVGLSLAVLHAVGTAIYYFIKQRKKAGRRAKDEL